jgi:OOP family OmpA-OmpF porin
MAPEKIAACLAMARSRARKTLSMKLHRTALWLLPLTLLAAPAARAEGLYLNGALMLRHYDLSQPGADHGSTDGDGYSLTPKLSGGWRFNDTWAVEAGYTSFGRPTHRYTRDGQAGELRAKSDAWFGAVRASTRLGENLTLFGKLGLDRHRFDVQASGAAAGLAQHKTTTALYLGTGLAWKLDQHWATTVELEHFGKDSKPGNGLNTVSVGLQYNF